MSIHPSHLVEAPALQKARWRIDPARSQVEFRTPTFWGLMTVNGHFDRYEGTLDLDEQPAIELNIEASSLDTHNKLRDRHLRSSDFFDVQNHPRVRFISNNARLTGEKLTACGRLEAAGRSMPVNVIATLHPLDGELEVNATAFADQFELGVSHGMLGMIRAPSELSVRGRLVAEPE